MPRDTLCRAIRLASRVYRFRLDSTPPPSSSAFSPRAEITHRVNVRRYAAAKRASMRAHASQASADGGADRTLAAFLRIPRPLHDVVFGRSGSPTGPVGRGRRCCGTSSKGSRLGRGARSRRRGPAVPRRRPPRLRRAAQVESAWRSRQGCSSGGCCTSRRRAWSEVFEVLASVPFTTAAGLLSLVLVGLYCYTFTLTASLRGLRHYQALIVNVCGSSIGNLLPGGGAAGSAATYSICRTGVLAPGHLDDGDRHRRLELLARVARPSWPSWA